MKKLLCIATIILVILASGVFSIAYAATELWDDFTVHAAQGQTVYPNYPDFSSKIGKGLTKDDFIITYSMSGNPTSSTFVFDSNGVTIQDKNGCTITSSKTSIKINNKLEIKK